MKSRLPLVAGLASVACVVFAAVVWIDFYQTAGPGSGHVAVGSYVDEHRTLLVASVLAVALAVCLVFVALASYFGSRGKASSAGADGEGAGTPTGDKTGTVSKPGAKGTGSDGGVGPSEAEVEPGARVSPRYPEPPYRDEIRVPATNAKLDTDPIAFILFGERCFVSTNRDVLLQVAAMLYHRHRSVFPERVKKAFNRSARKYPWISMDWNDFARSYWNDKIPGSPFHIAYRYNYPSDYWHELLETFGYDLDELTLIYDSDSR